MHHVAKARFHREDRAWRAEALAAPEEILYRDPLVPEAEWRPCPVHRQNVVEADAECKLVRNRHNVLVCQDRAQGLSKRADPVRLARVEQAERDRVPGERPQKPLVDLDIEAKLRPPSPGWMG